MLFVPFEVTIPESRQNPHLIDELSEELPGIFNWAYEGMSQLIREGRFIRPQRCKQAVAQYRRDVNPARAFLLDNYVQLEPHVKRGAKYLGFDNEGLPCSEVYQRYVQWCLDNGYRPLNSANFGKEVKRTFHNADKQRITRNGQRIQVYHGIAVREDAEIRYSMSL